MDIFEKAARQRIRFTEAGGSLTVEDLFALPLGGPTGKLNAIATALFKKVKDETPVSFVDEEITTESYDEDQLKFAIVKYIIDDKKAARRRAAELRDAKTEEQTLSALIAQREQKDLLELPLEELIRRRDAVRSGKPAKTETA